MPPENSKPSPRRGFTTTQPTAAHTLLSRIAELDEQGERLRKRQEQVRAELISIETGRVDEEDLRRALTEFDGVWSELVTKERQRLLRLLIEEIRFDGAAGEVEINFRGGGGQALAEGGAA